MKIGFTELLIVFIVALFAVGPDKLPIYAKKLGEALAQFRQATEDATKDIKKSIVEPLEEAQKPLREAMEPLKEMDEAIQGSVKDVRKSFADIGKEKKPAKQEQDPVPAPEPEQSTEQTREIEEETP